MLDNLFSSVLGENNATSISAMEFVLCIVVSLVLGGLLALLYSYKSRHTKSFLVTLALLPAIVCVVIMSVNVNIGAGVAVAGAFSLVRFRSVPGSAREICAIFMAMATGLITGMGYLMFAVVFVLLMGVITLFYQTVSIGNKKAVDRTLRITIPEDLDYVHVFDEIFERYTSSHETVNVKLTNLGSMFKLTYHITLKNADEEKQMIDEIRCRNGNLEIAISKQEMTMSEL